MDTFFPKFSKKRDGVNVIMEQKLLKTVNNLILNGQTCTGCGICAEACPEEAISLGLVGAVRRGAVDYAEPIYIDEKKCSYCGVCVVMCPFNSLTLTIDGEETLPIVEHEGFPEYDMVTTIDQDKCIRCTICEDVCPRDAISREVPAFEGTVDEALARQTVLVAKSTFTVDDEKCTRCGICSELCPAIDVKRKPFSAEFGAVVGDVVWDEKLCDGCEICVEACPEEAITFERVVESAKLTGKVEIIENLCCTCRWCDINCPTEAITVEKIFEGDIVFNAEKCPAGCSTCVEVCPANAIYLPTPKDPKDMRGERESVIAVNKDFCIFCGACVNACPGEDIITLTRTNIRMKGKETDLFLKIKEKLCTPRTSMVKETARDEVELKMMDTA